MGYIYKITNDINDKVYIGQTIGSVKTRWKKHLIQAKNKNGHFQQAIRKYGSEHFNVEILEQCSNERLDEREKYWISMFDSYKNGYNSTLGGQGIDIRDYSEVFELWDLGLDVTSIAKHLDLPYSTIISHIKNYDTGFKEKSTKFRHAINTKYVSAYNLDGSFIKTFASITNAARYFNLSISGIVNCCRGKTIASGEYQWRYGVSKENIGKIKRSGGMGYPVTQLLQDGTQIKTFKSSKEAERLTGISNTSISACCLGKRLNAGGYKWQRSKCCV